MSTHLKQDLSIGPNLKTLRKQAHLTREQVVAQLQLRNLPITRDILSKMEQGRYSVRVSVLLALKDIYHVDSFDAFFAGL